MKEIIEDLQQQLAFTLSKDLSGDWTEEYREGYADGLRQAISCLKEPCEDCQNLFDPADLMPYKYEPGFKLCQDCLDRRML